MTHSTQSLLRIATASLAMFTTVSLFSQSATPGSTSNAQIQTGASAGPGQGSNASGTAAASDSSYATGHPLSTTSLEGFWGHVNPMARKKWVKRELNPVKDRLNELDQLSASNAKQIKDVDERAQAGISKAQQAAQLADQHATEAATTATQAQQVAQQASTQTSQINNTVSNLDQYQTVNQVEIKFRRGQDTLGTNAKAALDQLATQLQDQKGYLVEIQGYSALRGPASITVAHRLATAVERYLVTQHQVPLYKIRQLSLGNAPISTNGSEARPHGSIVEVTLMHNSLSTLGASASDRSPIGAAQSSSNGAGSPPTSN